MNSNIFFTLVSHPSVSRFIVKEALLHPTKKLGPAFTITGVVEVVEGIRRIHVMRAGTDGTYIAALLCQ